MAKNKFAVINLIGWGLFLIIFIMGCQAPAKRPAPKKISDQEPTISLYLHETGKTKQINLEEYLEGVVAGEMDPHWPTEALAAQAILARTFTMKKIADGGVKSRGTDASTDIEEFQAYAPDKVNDQIRAAVKKTRGEVLTHRGHYINGWFHADSGGKTAASAAEGLDYHQEPTPYIVSVKDPGHRITAAENKNWTATFSLDEIRQAVKQVAGEDPGEINSVGITKKGPSGRATGIQVNGAVLSASALRLALGSEKMRSTLLTDLRLDGQQLLIKGNGFGHGVGLSQWGAKALAEQGKKAEEIVKFFFRNVKIEKRWN